MHKEYGKIEGDVTVTDELELYGMCVGNMSVVANGTLTLRGMCTGNLEILPGATVYLSGMVSGNVLNRGGRLEILGMIGGDLHEMGGVTIVGGNASVRGLRVTK